MQTCGPWLTCAIPSSVHGARFSNFRLPDARAPQLERLAEKALSPVTSRVNSWCKECLHLSFAMSRVAPTDPTTSRPACHAPGLGGHWRRALGAPRAQGSCGRLRSRLQVARPPQTGVCVRPITKQTAVGTRSCRRGVDAYFGAGAIRAQSLSMHGHAE